MTIPTFPNSTTSESLLPLRIMTFNVRYPNPLDGPNLWGRRRNLLVETISDSDPDALGTQELHDLQAEYLVQSLPAYRWFGRSRRGSLADEHVGIFYRADRLQLLDSGDFWLSDTPDIPASMAWGVSLPRMVTWGLFQPIGGPAGFYLFNTHFPHRPEEEEARTRSATLLADRLAQLSLDRPAVVTGDFNASPRQECYRILSQILRDAHDEAHRRSGPEETFHGFEGRPSAGRIDWILFRGPWKALECHTLVHNREGRYPSDHFPVLAVLKPAAVHRSTSPPTS
ncbi:MAG: endonuclease/exonuclease/phosphatase family protein [Acidobacteriota bacterium]